MTDLEKALKKREEFLRDNPKAQEYQKEIDNMLSRTRQQDRLQVLFMLMHEKQERLMESMSMLTSS